MSECWVGRSVGSVGVVLLGIVTEIGESSVVPSRDWKVKCSSE